MIALISGEGLLAIGLIVLFFTLWSIWCGYKERKEIAASMYDRPIGRITSIERTSDGMSVIGELDPDMAPLWPEEMTIEGTKVRHPSFIVDECMNPECPENGRCGGECLENYWDERAEFRMLNHPSEYIEPFPEPDLDGSMEFLAQRREFVEGLERRRDRGD